MECTPGAASKKLTRRQKVFVQKYLACWNQTHAAADAGFAFPNVAGAKLMILPHVQAAIAARLKEFQLDADTTLTRLSQQATVTPAMFFNFEWVIVKDGYGNPVIDPLTHEPQRRRVMVDVNWEVFEKYSYLVKKLTYDKDGRPVIEFHDAQNALIHIGKVHKLFVDRVDATNFNVGVSADELAAARAKAEQFESALLNNNGQQPVTTDSNGQ